MEELVQDQAARCIGVSMTISFVEYEGIILPLATYPNVGDNFVYPTLGLAGEAGEFAIKVDESVLSDPGPFSYNLNLAMLKELGDILWYVTSCAREIGCNLEEVYEGLTHFGAYTQTMKLELYPETDAPLVYSSLKMCGHAGEFADKIKKILRDKEGILEDLDRRILMDKLRKVVLCLNTCAIELGSDMEEVAQLNIDKLLDRNKRNVIHGEGDDR